MSDLARTGIGIADPAPGTTSSASRGRMYWAVSDSVTMVGRSLRLSVRNPDALVSAIALPLMLMLVFVYLFGGAIETGSAYVNHVVPGVILLCTSFGASMTAMSVCQDMVDGIIDRFRSMDIASFAVLTGHVAATLVRNIVSTALVVGVALLIGFRPNADVGEWLAVAGLLGLFVLAMAWLSATVGLIAKTPEAASGFTWFRDVPALCEARADVRPELIIGISRILSTRTPDLPMINSAHRTVRPGERTSDRHRPGRSAR